MALLGAGLLFFAGCKSAPPLSQSDALAMIQAKYNQTPPASFDITVTDAGSKQGIVAKYWALTKVYPNKYWGDLTLTPEGKKLVKVANGGDVIQWRPESAADKSFTAVVTTIAPCPIKARDMSDIQDAGEGLKTATFSEDVSLDALPRPLQDIVHNPGNKISTKRTATFNLVDNAWKLQSIQ
jgi:hypothetical protein